jgi:hypothetical protein
MKKLILASALSATALLLSACGDGADDEAAVDDTTVVETDAGAAGATSADAAWPRGTRIVEEAGVTYRVNPDGTRVEIAGNEWRIVTEGETRYRVGTGGVRYEIDDDGADLDGAPDGGDPDIDIGTNEDGNLDIDVSTDGTDATPEDGEN